MKTSRDDGINSSVYNTLHTFLIIQLCGKICKMVLYTELFYAIIPACFHTFCCSVIPTVHLHTFLMFFTLVIIRKIVYFWSVVLHPASVYLDGLYIPRRNLFE